MYKIIEQIIQTERIIASVMLIPFIIIQLRLRKHDLKDGLLRRVRFSAIFSTSSFAFYLLVTYIYRNFTNSVGIHASRWIEIISFIGINFVLLSIIYGTKLFFDIQSGRLIDEKP